MSDYVRSEVSKKNKYWIEKHRYYELKHFCLQYPIWKKALNSLEGLAKKPMDEFIFSGVKGDPTEKCAEARTFYANRMKIIEKSAAMTDPVIGIYILEGVTQGSSYTTLNTKHNLPCCKDVYYELYRKFFYILNKLRE